MRKEERDFIDACRFGHIEEAAKILETGVDMDIRDSDGWAPLHIVCLHGYTAIARLLLSHGADVNALTEDDKGCTPLYFACLTSETEIARLLLSRGADVNRADNTGATPLHFAASTGKSDIVRILFEAGAQAAATDDNVSTALDLATDLSVNNPAREEIIELFRQYAPEMVMEKFCTKGPHP